MFSPDGSLIVLLEHLLLPPGGGLLLLLLGFVCMAFWRSLARILIVVGTVFAVATSLPVVARQLAGMLERPYTEIVLPLDRADALVVPAAGRVSGQRDGASDAPDPLTLERLRHTARLYRSSALPILLSGGGGSIEGRRSEAELMADVLLVDYRVPPRWLETRSRDTCESARLSAEILREEGLETVFVVTHAMHMSRALRCFRDAGLSPLPAPLGFRGPEGSVSYQPADFLPSLDAIETSRFALREWLARLAAVLRSG